MAQNFCPNCGSEIKYSEAEICPNCGVRLKDPTNQSKEHEEEKSPIIALICSIFIPGLGQVYNGQLEKGVLILIGTLIGTFVFIIPGIIVWIFGWYDAYTTADKMNLGKIQFKSTKVSHIIIFFIIGIVLVAITIILALIAFAFLAGVTSAIPASSPALTIPIVVSQTISPIPNSFQPSFNTNQPRCSIEGEWRVNGQGAYYVVNPEGTIQLNFDNGSAPKKGTWVNNENNEYTFYWTHSPSSGQPNYVDSVYISSNCNILEVSNNFGDRVTCERI